MTTTIDRAFVGYLRSQAAVAQLVQDRIRPDALAQDDTYPAMAFTLVSAQRDMTQSGPSGVAVSRYQFDLYAESAGQVQDLAAAMRAVLIGTKDVPPSWRATTSMADADGQAVEVQAVFLEDDDSGWIAEDRLYWRRLDFEFTHIES